ncbi:MAG: LegC family aminotransferase [Bacteroidetes bacterium]|nr:LegC family aminotransferase [Bacteroidota bacterium]
MKDKFQKVVDFIRSQFPEKDFIPLHEPLFIGNERKYVLDAIDSTFVSSVGAYVNRFEEMMATITGARYAVATVNGTAALHIGLMIANVKPGDEVLTQAFTFIATANAISYLGATPIFIDIDQHTLGMSAERLSAFLKANAILKAGVTINKRTGKKIAACVPMHSFGFPCEIDNILEVCKHWNIPVVEDAAESLGSYYNNQHTGSFGLVGTFSFNGNKTVTCGGGGVIVTNNEKLAQLAKHLTTQAKVPHAWDFTHDHIGYNYRMPNLNAAFACAQLEQLEAFVVYKRDLAHRYARFFSNEGISFVEEPKNARSNYWLNVLLLKDRQEKDSFLSFTNEQKVMTRPAWTLMNKLPMFSSAQHDGLEVSQDIENRLVNIPSSVIVK